MRIVALAIGDELLSGEIFDTNTHFLAKKLFSCGHRLSLKVTASDRTLVSELKNLKGHFDLLITSGGLGPTHDDVTGQSVEEAFGVSLASAEKLVNPVGSASGLLIQANNSKILLLPGVPKEFEAMVEMHLKNLVKEGALFARRVNYCQLREEEIAPLLVESEKEFPGIEIGVYPRTGSLSVVVRGKASTSEEFTKKTDPLIEKLYESYPTLVFPGEAIEEAIHEELLRRGETLALAESCTGGALAERFTRKAGASNYFLTSIVAYSDTAKETFLDISPRLLQKEGAVSEAVVREMADALFKKTKADWVITVSGIAGPTGGTTEKPVGTVWAAIGKRGEGIVTGLIPLRKGLPRKANIERSVAYLLSTLWRKMAFSITAFT